MLAQRSVLGLVLFLVSLSSLAGDGTYQVIAYHDVRDFVRADIDADQYAISTANLIEHFTWLRANGFVPVSIDDIMRAQRGESELPDRAVLLTFDDGFESIYTHVYPLLKLFNYPAVISVVTAWINGDATEPTDDVYVGGHRFLTWDQLRELRESGLVEIASHSHNLHRGILANPQGNKQPAAVTREYSNGHYESDAEYAERIRQDLATSRRLIEEHTGRAPRIMTWPYGAYNERTLAIAHELGMDMTLTLTSGINTLASSSSVSRHLALANPEVEQLGFDLLYTDRPPIVRVAQVDLDYIYDEDPGQQEQNLSRLLDRIKALEISHVYLQAFADPDADGGAQSLYFPNRHLPVRADLFNRVAWQLRTRSQVRVYAWLPILSYEASSISRLQRVMQFKDGKLSFDENSEPRLSVFDPRTRKIVSDIYEDLARYTSVDGILFHDDGRLNEFEDANPRALAAYRQEFGPTFSIPAAQSDPELMRRWAEFKSQRILDFTKELERVVRRYRPDIKTARNLFSGTLLDSDGEIYLAQNFNAFVGAYDYVALMAMPYFENAADPRTFYGRLIAAVARNELGLGKTVFELQTVDWQTNLPIPAAELRDTMRWLQANGVKHIGYYPDDFIDGTPTLTELRHGMSLATYPLVEPR